MSEDSGDEQTAPTQNTWDEPVEVAAPTNAEMQLQ